jgi:hypothetical protein
MMAIGEAVMVYPKGHQIEIQDTPLRMTKLCVGLGLRMI